MSANEKIPVVRERSTFSKNERLSGRKLITTLFSKGKIISIAPFRMIWMKQAIPETSPAQAAFSVPVKNFKSAVDRNRIKRQMREVYRKNKSSLYALLEREKTQCVLMLVFTGKTSLPYAEIENKLKLTLRQLEEEIKENGS